MSITCSLASFMTIPNILINHLVSFQSNVSISNFFLINVFYYSCSSIRTKLSVDQFIILTQIIILFIHDWVALQFIIHCTWANLEHLAQIELPQIEHFLLVDYSSNAHRHYSFMFFTKQMTY